MTVALAGFVDQIFDWYRSLSLSGAYAAQVLRIIGIDLVLAGDNAVVIALACRLLPPKQRMAGIVLGATAAVVLRVLFTLIVQELLGQPLLKLAGGLLLFWIAVKLVIAGDGEEGEGRSGSTVWEAVRIVALADLVMSLDNVIAIAAAAHGDTGLIILGLLVSIPLVVAGATLISNLLTRYPIFVWLGAALLGWVAGELIASEPSLAEAFRNLAAALAVSQTVITYLMAAVGAVLVCAVGYAILRSEDRAIP